MKLKLGEVLPLLNVVRALLHDDLDGKKVSRKMPFKIKHRLLKAEGKFKKEAGPYEEERVALVREFGEPIEGSEDGAMKVKEDSEKDFYAKLQEVLNTDIEMNLDFCKLTDDDIDAIEGEVNLADEEIVLFQKYMVIAEGEDIVKAPAEK